MVETSDDRNGVVVNRARRGVHAIDSTRGIPSCLVEQRCIESSEISAKSEHCSDTVPVIQYHTYSALVGPKSGFLQR